MTKTEIRSKLTRIAEALHDLAAEAAVADDWTDTSLEDAIAAIAENADQVIGR